MDHPPAAAAPWPFDLCLASIGTCAGIYVFAFCRQRGPPTEDLRIVERVHRNQFSSMVEKIDLAIRLPGSFPEKHRNALVRTAELCGVKSIWNTRPHLPS